MSNGPEAPRWARRLVMIVGLVILVAAAVILARHQPAP